MMNAHLIQYVFYFTLVTLEPNFVGIFDSFDPIVLVLFSSITAPCLAHLDMSQSPHSLG